MAQPLSSIFQISFFVAIKRSNRMRSKISSTRFSKLLKICRFLPSEAHVTSGSASRSGLKSTWLSHDWAVRLNKVVCLLTCHLFQSKSTWHVGWRSKPNVEFMLRIMFSRLSVLNDVSETVEHVVNQDGCIMQYVPSADEWEISCSCQRLRFHKLWPCDLHGSHAQDLSCFSELIGLRLEALLKNSFGPLARTSITLFRFLKDHGFQLPSAR